MHLASVKAHRGAINTPLRYPGGKTRLTGFLRRVIETGGWGNVPYVEPYAGGAGAAISLLRDSVVPRIVVNDLDPCIYAFWKSITSHPSDFLAKFDETSVTLDEWHEQREVYRKKSAADPVALGFATFFLNRTNRSGVLNAGVIGGQAQTGTYRLDARFNREVLREKLEWIGANASAIEVRSVDGIDLLKEVFDGDSAFCYIDPPYFDKGAFLYMNSFAAEGHSALAALLREHRSARWVLTYDDVPAIRTLYRGMYQGTFSLPYSAHKAEMAKERMVLADRVAGLEGVM